MENNPCGLTNSSLKKAKDFWVKIDGGVVFRCYECTGADIWSCISADVRNWIGAEAGRRGGLSVRRVIIRGDEGPEGWP